MVWSLAVYCVNEGTAFVPFNVSAAYTFQFAHPCMQVVLPSQGAITAASFELPERSAPNQTTTTCPAASAATAGNTFDFPTVAPELTRTGAVHTLPCVVDDDIQIFELSDHTANVLPLRSTASAGKICALFVPGTAV